MLRCALASARAKLGRVQEQIGIDAAAAGEQLVPASEYRALEAQVRELHRLLGKKAIENELLREAVSRAAGSKTAVALDLVARGWPVSAVAAAIGITRQHLSAMRNRPLSGGVDDRRCPTPS